MRVWAVGAMVLGWMASPVFATTLNPPNSLSFSEVGNSNHGIQFIALDESTITSFIYNYQGNADTVELTTVAGTILDMISIPANGGTNPSAFTAFVNWSLLSGTTYRLIGTTTSNGLLGGASYPVSDADISAISGIFSSSQSSSFWGDFSGITTEASSGVPEGYLALPTLAALAGMLLVRRRMARTSRS